MKVLVPCAVQKGMFENEYAVEITTVDGAKVSFFADRSLLRNQGGKWLLEVNLVDDDEKSAERTVLLPSESFEKGSRWLSVPSEDLAPA